MYNTCLAKGNPKRTLWGSLARSVYKWYTGEYSTKPPITKPPINGCPRDGGGYCSVTRTGPNVSEASPMQLRYERRGRWEVDNYRWVDFRKVVGLWIRKSLAFECGPWEWYRGMGEAHMSKGKVGEDRGSKETDRCPLTGGSNISNSASTHLSTLPQLQELLWPI
jgi:hypothetical protein